MSFEDIVIQFRNFHPSDFTKNYLQDQMQEIRQECPRCATVRATFNRKNKTLQAIIKVTSSAGTYFASTTGSGLQVVIRRLLQQVRRQFERQKSRSHKKKSLRRSPEILKAIEYQHVQEVKNESPTEI